MAFVVSQAAKLLLEDARYRVGITRTPSRIEYIRRAAPSLKRVAGVAFGAAAGFVAAKRSKMTVDQVMSEMATQSYGGKRAITTVGGHSVTQRGYAKGKFGKRPTKKAKLALKLVRATLASGICRFQRVGKYEEAKLSYQPAIGAPPASANAGYNEVPIPLGHWGFTSTSNNSFQPVCIFDLTSINGRLAGVNRTGNVCYNLFRNATSTQGYYQWGVVRGQNPSGFNSGSGEENSWFWESCSNNTEPNDVYARPTMTKTSYLDWVDVRMNLYGAKKQATNFTVSLIQFLDRAWDPEIQPFQVPSVENMRSADEQAQYDAAWDEFLKPKVFNPIASAGKSKNQLWKTLYTKRYTVNPDLSNNEDDNPPNINVKLFHNLNRVTRYDWRDPATPVPIGATSVQKIVSDGVYLTSVNTGLDGSAFNQQLDNNSSAYVHPRAKVFLMVTAEAFTKYNLTDTGDPYKFNRDGFDYRDIVPNFDIVIRKKVTYDSDA